MPIMNSYLNHIRLDVITENPGIAIEMDGDVIRQVIVYQK
jgi:hypothetical protein